MTLTRRQTRLLLAAAAWSLYVWISRIVIMMGGDESFGFKAVHLGLAVVSIAFAIGIGRIGLAARRAARQGRKGSEPVAMASTSPKAP